MDRFPRMGLASARATGVVSSVALQAIRFRRRSTDASGRGRAGSAHHG